MTTSQRTFQVTHEVTYDDVQTTTVEAMYYATELNADLVEFKNDDHAVVFAVPVKAVRFIDAREPTT
jgi:hypothetical protein